MTLKVWVNLQYKHQKPPVKRIYLSGVELPDYFENDLKTLRLITVYDLSPMQFRSLSRCQVAIAYDVVFIRFLPRVIMRGSLLNGLFTAFRI